jgi:hypothetical protein
MQSCHSRRYRKSPICPAVPPLASGLKLISFESAAKVGSEPTLTDAAHCTYVGFGETERN